jgi:hypothetical protein
LENGTNYQVRVRAHNRAPDPSSWSAYSAGMVPAAPPSAPAAPTTTRLEPVGTQAQMQVNWNAPAANGDAISGYRLTVIRGGSVVRTVPVAAGQTSQALAIDASTSDYTFTVAAQNKAGWGADSAPSAPRRAFTPPGAPTNVQASTPANDSRIVVTYGPAAGNGANANEIRYEYNVGGGWRGDWDGRTISAGIANNNTYTVQVRAYTQLDGVRYDGPASNPSNAAAPYGPIGQPGASASANGTNITFNWSAPSRNGRDIVKMEIAIDGVTGWKTVGASGSETHDVGYSQSRAIQVRATDAAGQVSTSSASARSADPPQPRAWPSKGSSAVGQYRCSDLSCAYAVLNVSNFPAGDYTLSCNGTGPWGGQWGAAVYSVPANGSIQLNCYFGDPGEEFWILIHGRGESERIRWY